MSLEAWELHRSCGDTLLAHTATFPEDDRQCLAAELEQCIRTLRRQLETPTPCGATAAAVCDSGRQPPRPDAYLFTYELRRGERNVIVLRAVIAVPTG